MALAAVATSPTKMIFPAVFTRITLDADDHKMVFAVATGADATTGMTIELDATLTNVDKPVLSMKRTLPVNVPLFLTMAKSFDPELVLSTLMDHVRDVPATRESPIWRPVPADVASVLTIVISVLEVVLVPLTRNAVTSTANVPELMVIGRGIRALMTLAAVP